MTERLVGYLWEQAVDEMKFYFFVFLALGITGVFLLGLFYRLSQDTRYIDDLLNLTLICASCIFFFSSGFFLSECLDAVKYPEHRMLKKTSWLEDQIRNRREVRYEFGD